MNTENTETTTHKIYTVSAPLVRAQFAERRRSGLRAKDAAEAIGLPEGAVIGAHAGAHDEPLQAMPLKAEWVALLQALEACGMVMALTRNESTVHEKEGVYRDVSANGPIGIALSREIDLRMFFMHWHAGYAVTELPHHADRPATRSLQFFDAQGVAVHKIYAREATDMVAWDALVARFSATDATPALFRHAAPRKEPAQDAAIDVPGLRTAWGAMQDTHEFFELLRRFGAERQQSFRLVEGGFTEKLNNEGVTQLLNNAAVDGVSIMVFVPNAGCIQIHSGPVRNIQPLETPGGTRWINVLDQGFNLHLRTDMVASTWVVRKPTADGIVTSVELFDGKGDLMAMFFGERKPGVPELQSWRELVAQLQRLSTAQEVTA